MACFQLLLHYQLLTRFTELIAILNKQTVQNHTNYTKTISYFNIVPVFRSGSEQSQCTIRYHIESLHMTTLIHKTENQISGGKYGKHSL